MTSNEGKWVRECTEFEQMMEFMQKSKCLMVTHYFLTYNSKEKFQKETLEEAFKHLFRKILTLRLSVSFKEGKMFFKEMESEDIDYKEIPDADLLDAFVNKVGMTPFDSMKGPMWRVRTSSTLEEDFSSRDIPLEYKYRTNVLFTFHHSITDGHSSVRICGYLTNFLNDIVNKVPIDNTQLVTFSDGHTLGKENSERVKQILSNDPERYDKMMAELKEHGTIKPSFVKAFPLKSGQNIITTRSIRHNFDKTVSKNFLAKSKQNGVSCHASFFTAVQVALVKILEEENLNESSYTFVTGHVLNTRRFWSKDANSELCFGANISQVRTKFDVTKSSYIDFWALAKKFKTQFVQKMAEAEEFNFVLMDYYKKIASTQLEAPHPDHYYDTNNLGDVTNMITGNFDANRIINMNSEPEVMITDFARSTCIHEVGKIHSHVLHSFKGRLLFSIDYNDNYIDGQLAQRYLDAVVKTVEEVANC